MDRPTESLAPNGARTTIYYDANDNPTNILVRDANDGDRLLMQSGAGYDALDRPTTLTEETGVGTAINSIQYLSAQRQVKLTDPINSQTTVGLDNVGRIGQIQNPTATLTYAYDVPGRTVQSTLTDATGPSSDVYHYNPLGYVDQYQDASQQTYSFARGFDGRLMTATTPEQQVYQNTHSVLGEPLSMSRPNGQTLTARYDERRELTSLAPTPVPGVGMSFSYDASGRLTNSLAADNKGAKHRAFNAFMQPTLSDLPRGLVVSNLYDQTGRRLQREITGLPSGPREDFWSYDALDRVKSATNPFAVVSYTYDLQGYAREIQFGQFGTNWVLGQIADLMGVRTNLTYPDGLVINLARDTNSRLDKILPVGIAPVIRSSTYATPSQVGTRLLDTNAISAEFLYDANRRPLVRRFRRASDSNLLAEVRYAYDGSGMQTARQFIHRGGRTDLFGYDGSHKVTRADIGARPPVAGELPRTLTGFSASGWAAGLYAREYGYTDTEVLSGVNLRNPDALAVPPFATNFAVPDITLHVPQIDGVTRNRDDAGNVTSGRVWVRIPGNPVPQPVLANFVYNELNQLTRVERADGVLVENTFGPTGLRIQRRVTGSTALCVPSNYEYLYEGINLIEIRDLDQPGHPLRARFYYGDNGDELVAGDLWDAASGQLKRVYYLTDSIGSVMALADAAGNIVERYDYDTWGEVTIEAPDTSAPRVSKVTREGNDLVIEFTEPVLPALPANDGKQIVRTLRNPAEAFQVLSNGVALAGRVQFEELSTGRSFGTSFRFVATNALPAQLQLAVAGGLLVDGSGNTNLTEQLNLASGTNAYSGPVGGSTAPATLAYSALASPFAFQGQINDPDAGLIYMRVRFYDPALGEFLQRDPYGYEDSVNQYAGLANTPLNRRDPTGTKAGAETESLEWVAVQEAGPEHPQSGPRGSVATIEAPWSEVKLSRPQIDYVQTKAGIIAAVVNDTIARNMIDPRDVYEDVPKKMKGEEPVRTETVMTDTKTVDALIGRKRKKAVNEFGPNKISSYSNQRTSSIPRLMYELGRKESSMSSLGLAGSARNIGDIITEVDPGVRSCNPIGLATAAAINKAVKEGRLPGVIRAEAYDRQTFGGVMFHTATRVFFKDGSDAIFDWHATLDPRNPQIKPVQVWDKGSLNDPNIIENMKRAKVKEQTEMERMLRTKYEKAH